MRVDVTAPTTAILINGAAPLQDYTAPVRVAFTRTDERGLGAAETEYRVNDGEWTKYENAFDLSADRGYQIDFRSTDLAGNVENYQAVTFTIRRPVVGAPTSSRRRRRRRLRGRSRRSRRSPRGCRRCPRCAAAASRST